MEEPRFKKGDKITYKSIKDCGGKYFFGGGDHGGFVGTVEKYHNYIHKQNCYRLSVTIRGGVYDMLESEFEEYDLTSKDPAYDIY